MWGGGAGGGGGGRGRVCAGAVRGWGLAVGGEGTGGALASPDLVLITSDLRRLATCIRLSRHCRRTIHVNVAVGLGWTVALVVLAACGLLGPEGAIVAAVVHNLSTLAGMANAGRLLLFDETDAGRRAKGLPPVRLAQRPIVPVGS